MHRIEGRDSLKGCWGRAGKNVRADVGEAVGDGLLSQGSSAWGRRSHCRRWQECIGEWGCPKVSNVVVQKVLLLSVQEGPETFEDLAVDVFTIAGKARAGGGI